MSATDTLNVHQWPLDEVGKLRSGNRLGISVEEEYQAHQRGDFTEGDIEHAQAYGFDHPVHYQDELNRHVATHGIATNGYWGPGDESLDENPSDKYLVNGAHRYEAARTLGHATMPMAKYPDMSDGDLYKARQPRVAGWKGSR